jgi:hypothetical protein
MISPTAKFRLQGALLGALILAGVLLLVCDISIKPEWRSTTSQQHGGKKKKTAGSNAANNTDSMPAKRPPSKEPRQKERADVE